MNAPVSPDTVDTSGLPRPGPLGRLGRLLVGLYQLWFVTLIVRHFTAMVLRPPRGTGFWIMLVWALWEVSPAVNLAFVRRAGVGPRVRWLVIGVLAAAMALGWVTNGAPWSAPGIPLLLVFMAVAHAYGGLCHVVAGAIGLPGCELRVPAWIVARARGMRSSFAPCHGIWSPLDRWERRHHGWS